MGTWIILYWDYWWVLILLLILQVGLGLKKKKEPCEILQNNKSFLTIFLQK